jgi:hypothetical protein
LLANVFKATGHRIFKLYTSKMIPVAVKATLKAEYENITLPVSIDKLPYGPVSTKWEAMEQELSRIAQSDTSLNENNHT